MSIFQRLSVNSPKRILALDGGGIRGVLSLAFLARVEDILRRRYGRPDFVLSDYFDLIGGTSTGSIIATGLAIGMPIAEIRKLYNEAGEKAFGHRLSIISRLRATYDQAPLEMILRSKLNDDTIGSPNLKTGLCIFTKRADTNSLWMLHNHPRGRYFQAMSEIPLWKAVRASTAAPSFFLPELFEIPDRGGNMQSAAFVDGGISMANNPALQLFLLATVGSYPFKWALGADKLYLMSVGTGTWDIKRSPDEVANDKLWDWGRRLPGMFMDDASWQGQLLLQWLSKSPTPWTIDREVGDLKDFTMTENSVLSYVRYDVRLDAHCMKAMKLEKFVNDIDIYHEMDNTTARHALGEIGEAASRGAIKDTSGRIIQFGVEVEHLPPEFDVAPRAIARKH